LTGKCSECNAGFYLKNDSLYNQCVKCDVSCDSCINSPNNCITCANNYYKKDTFEIGKENFCYLLFALGKEYYVDKNNKLKLCDKSCDGCFVEDKKCEKCQKEYYNLSDKLGNEKYYCYKLHSKYYLDIEKLILNPCDVSCKECKTTAKYCLICEEGYIKKASEYSNSECFKPSSILIKLENEISPNITDSILLNKAAYDIEKNFANNTLNIDDIRVLSQQLENSIGKIKYKIIK
jgi:hypothetical protein